MCTSINNFRLQNNELIFVKFLTVTVEKSGTRWRTWLRHCATTLKVAGSIPSGVIGIFLLT
jgi:hypothetical protein